MPIVGTAYVRLRVISDKLSGDISDAVKRSVNASSRDLDTSGEDAGARVSRGVARGVRNGAGDARRAGGELGDNIGDGVDDSVSRRLGPRIRRSLAKVRDDFDFKSFARAGGNFADSLGDGFNLGIGRAKMGPAIRAALAVAGPSVLSGVAALGTAMASEIITAMAAIGPGIAGGIGLGLAAVSSLALNFGLVMAAFKFSSSEVLGDFNKRLDELKKAFGQPIGEGMVSGLLDGLSSLERVVPQINDLLRTTGERFGDVFRGIGAVVERADNLGRLRGILSTNLGFIDNLGRGINGLITSFLTLFNAAKPFIDYLGQGIARFGEWAEASLTVAEANGSLAAWMDRMLEKWKQLWQAMKDWGAGFKNVFDAALPAGETLMSSIANIGQRFREWTSDEGNMSRMTAFFEKAHLLASKVWEMLGNIFAAGGRAFEGMNLTPILTVLDEIQFVIAPAIARIWNQIQEGAGGNLVQIIQDIGTVFTKIADSGVIGRVAADVSALMAQLSGFLASDIGSAIAGMGAAWLLFGGAITSVLRPVMALGTALLGLSGPVLLIVGIAAAVAGAFALMWANSEPFRASIENLVTSLRDKFMAIWDKISPKLESFWEKLNKLAGVIGDKLAPVIQDLAPVFVAVFDIIGNVIGYIIDQLGEFIDFIANVLSGDWEAAWENIKNMFVNLWNFLGEFLSGIWNLITSVASTIWNALFEIVSGVLGKIWGIVQSVWNWVYDHTIQVLINLFNTGTAKIEEFGNWIQTKWNEIPEMARAVWDWVYDHTIQVLINLYNTGTAKIEEFGNWIQTKWNELLVFAGQVWDWIFEHTIQKVIDLYNGLVDWFTRADAWVKSVWEGIPGFMSGLWDRVFDAVIQPVIDLYNGLVEWFEKADAWVKSVFEGIPGAVGAIWDQVYDAIVQPVIDAYNGVVEWVGKVRDAITGAWDWVVGKVSEVNAKLAEIADKMAATQGADNPLAPAVSLSSSFERMMTRAITAGMPPVGQPLAAGGTVPATFGGQFHLLGEAGRPERVEPLDSSGMSDRDKAMIDRIVSNMTSAIGLSGDVNVTVKIGERPLRDMVTSEIVRANDTTARNIKNGRRRSA